MKELHKNSSCNMECCELTIYEGTDCRGKHLDTTGCAIVLVQRGFGVADVNGIKFPLVNGSIGILFYDDKTLFENVSSNFKCAVIRISYGIIEDTIYKVTTDSLWSFINDNPFFRTNDRQLLLLKSWWQQITWILTYCSSCFRNDMVCNSTHNLLMAIDSELQKNGIEQSPIESNRARMLANKYLELIAKYHAQSRDVEFYAEKLSIAPSYLYKVTMRVLKVSPKELIDGQVVHAIKELLVNTDLSVKNIAAELHFPDASYMCRFFSRKTGTTPTSYRTKI